jgi:hypothetical protein
VVDVVAMIDRFGGDFDKMEHLLPDFAMAAIDYSKMDPSTFKDIFENPKTFQEAWHHPDPFQQQQWQTAILKEFKRMVDNGVWKKIKRIQLPTNRQCVKHKWIFEIKRNGVFRARLVACGYSQDAGIDFSEVYSPVATDVSF